jgi:nicotinate-nucleotide adenylyltransferase
MNIALLGGAFNPPHFGHILIAQQVLDFGGVDELWFLPNWGQQYLGGDAPFKVTASVEDRLTMARMLSVPRTSVSTIEIDNKLDGQTIHLLPHLPKEHTYSFVIGSDWLASFHMWRGWEELLKFMSFIVFPRNGFPTEPLYPNMRILTHQDLVLSNISSTKIRNRMRNGLSIDAFVPTGVANYVKEHKLYL